MSFRQMIWALEGLEAPLLICSPPPSLPSAACVNVLSNHLSCKGLLSLVCRIPSLCTYKIELPFIFLHVNTYPGMGYRIKPDPFGRKATWYPSINMCDCTILTGSLPALKGQECGWRPKKKKRPSNKIFLWFIKFFFPFQMLEELIFATESIT